MLGKKIQSTFFSPSAIRFGWLSSIFHNRIFWQLQAETYEMNLQIFPTVLCVEHLTKDSKLNTFTVVIWMQNVPILLDPISDKSHDIELKIGRRVSFIFAVLLCIFHVAQICQPNEAVYMQNHYVNARCVQAEYYCISQHIINLFIQFVFLAIFFPLVYCCLVLFQFYILLHIRNMRTLSSFISIVWQFIRGSSTYGKFACDEYCVSPFFSRR